MYVFVHGQAQACHTSGIIPFSMDKFYLQKGTNIMKVTGIETRNVIVEITAEECIRALAKENQVEQMLFPPHNTYWEEEHDIQGNLIQLTEMQDISRHGSSDYQPTGNYCKQKFYLKCYTHLKALKKLLVD